MKMTILRKMGKWTKDAARFLHGLCTIRVGLCRALNCFAISALFCILAQHKDWLHTSMIIVTGSFLSYVQRIELQMFINYLYLLR